MQSGINLPNTSSESEEQSHYLTPKLIFMFGRKEPVNEEYLYRGDTRKPINIFEQGFKSRGNNMDLNYHVRIDGPESKSAYISTSTSKDIAKIFPQYCPSSVRLGFLYEVNWLSNAVDITKKVDVNPLDQMVYKIVTTEKEMAIPGQIKSSDIRGAWPVEIADFVEDRKKYHIVRHIQEDGFIPNPSYVAPNAGVAKVFTGVKVLGGALMVMGMILDAKSLYKEYEVSQKSGDYSHLFCESARIAGAWSGAAVVGADFAANAAPWCVGFGPWGPPTCGMLGGAVGSLVGYIAGGELAKNLAQSFLHFKNKNIQLLEGAKTNNIQMMHEASTAGADVNIKDRSNHDNTPLILASRNGHLDVVKYLLDNGADPNLANQDKNLAIHEAIKHNHIEVVKTLVRANSNLRARDKDGKTPYEVARDCDSEAFEIIAQKVESCDRDLIEGARNGNFQLIREALPHANVNIIIRPDHDNTPLILASRNGHLDVVKYLLDNGADPNLANQDKNLAIHEAIKNHHIEIVALLVGAGSDLRARDKDGKTPYEVARDCDSDAFEIIATVVEMHNEEVAEAADHYYQNEQFSEALDALNELDMLKGGLTPQGHSMRGDCYRKLNRDGDAMVEYNKAIEMDSHNLSHYINFTDLCFHRGQYQDCINLLNKYLGFEPTDSNAKAALNDYEAFYATKLYESAHHDTALEYARRCLGRDPSHPVANGVIGTYNAAVQEQARQQAAQAEYERQSRKAWGRAWAQQQVENNRQENYRRMDQERAISSQRASISNMQMMQQANAASQASLARQTQSVRDLQIRVNNSIAKFTQHNNQFISMLRANEAKGGNLASCLFGGAGTSNSNTTSGQSGLSNVMGNHSASNLSNNGLFKLAVIPKVSTHLLAPLPHAKTNATMGTSSGGSSSHHNPINVTLVKPEIRRAECLRIFNPSGGGVRYYDSNSTLNTFTSNARGLYCRPQGGASDSWIRVSDNPHFGKKM